MCAMGCQMSFHQSPSWLSQTVMSQCGSFIPEKLLRVAQKTEYGVRGRQSLWIKDAWLGAGHSPPTWFDVEPRFPIRSVRPLGRAGGHPATPVVRVVSPQDRSVSLMSRSEEESLQQAVAALQFLQTVAGTLASTFADLSEVGNMSAQQAVALRQASLEVQLLRFRAAEKSQKAVCRQRGHTSATSHHHQKASG